jgi:hypothetical protein
MSKENAFMDVSHTIIILTCLVALLAAIATATGLFLKQPGEPFTITSLWGQTAQIYGRGLYRHNTRFFAAGTRGQDAVALFLGVPLLLFALLWYARGSLAGHLLLTGVLGYVLYLYASMAMGIAYNRLFLLYIVIFSASLFAFVLAFATVDLDAIAAAIPSGLPVRGLGIFMIAAGLVTAVVWGGPLVSALRSGGPPDRMDHYTTMVTYALDLAIITPATLICALLVLRGAPLGYVIAAPLLTLVVLLAPQIIVSTLFQRAAGVPFTTAEMVGPVSGFVVLGAIAAWLLVDILRHV